MIAEIGRRDSGSKVYPLWYSDMALFEYRMSPSLAVVVIPGMDKCSPLLVDGERREAEIVEITGYEERRGALELDFRSGSNEQMSLKKCNKVANFEQENRRVL